MSLFIIKMVLIVKALLAASVLLSLRFSLTESAPESALVTKISGFSGTFPSKHYAG